MTMPLESNDGVTFPVRRLNFIAARKAPQALRPDRAAAVEKITGLVIVQVLEPQFYESGILPPSAQAFNRVPHHILKRPPQFRRITKTLPFTGIARPAVTTRHRRPIAENTQIFFSAISAGIGMSGNGVNKKEVLAATARVSPLAMSELAFERIERAEGV